MKKLLSYLLVIVLIASLLAGCGSQEASGTGVNVEGQNDTLIIGVVNTPPTIDHSSGAGMASQYLLLDNVMATGARYPMKPEPGMEFIETPDLSDLTKLNPFLYESWEVSEDRQTATIKLREGVISAYGNELTTADVLWKYERHFALQAVGAFIMAVLDVPDASHVEIVDKYTYKLHSEGPNALQEAVSANVYDTIWDSTEAKKYATEQDPWAINWISRYGGGFAAYYVTEFSADDRIILEANPNWWEPEPAIKKIMFLVIPESSSRVAMLKAGQIDIATELSPREIDSLMGEPGVNVASFPSNNFNMLVLNQELVEPFADVRVRQAINYAIPHDKIIETAYYGKHAIPWKAAIPSMYPGVLSEDDWMYDYDLEKAKALLADAGYSDGFDIELYYSEGWPAHEAVCVQIRESLAEIGINVELRKTPTGSFDTQVRSYQLPFALLQELPAVPDPFYSLFLYYLSLDAGGSYGAFGHYSNPELDAALVKGMRTWPLDEQYKEAAKVQKIIMEDAPMGWVAETNYTVAMRDDIEGMNWTLGQGNFFNYMKINR